MINKILNLVLNNLKTILNEEGDSPEVKGDSLGNFKITFYTREHDPPHAHITKDGRSIGKFILTNEKPSSPAGFISADKRFALPSTEIGKIIKFMERHKNYWNKLKKEWNRLNPYLTQLKIDKDEVVQP
jgi:hypothetical protein